MEANQIVGLTLIGISALEVMVYRFMYDRDPGTARYYPVLMIGAGLTALSGLAFLLVL